MAEAFICDYVRTPIGRFGGALSSVRADDLGAIPLQGADGSAIRSSTRRQIDEVLLRLRQPGRRGQPQCRAHGLLLAGLPVAFPASRSTGCAAPAWTR